MKRIIALGLAILMILSLCACGNGNQPAASNAASAESAAAQGGETANAGIRIGFAKENITPQENVPLSGSANRGTSSGMLEYLFASCLAISFGENDVALVFGMDIQNAYSPTPGWRKDVSRIIGIPEDRIQICFTHTHSAPNTGSDDPSIGRYNRLVSEKMVKAAKAAIDDLAPAEAAIATIDTENMNFVRRYIMNDGTLCGDNWGSMASGIKSHETEVDNQLQVIRFTREGAEDVILTNFQMHSNYTIGDTAISSDVAGAFRDALEKKSGVNVMYLNGASGNINPKSRIAEENVVKSHKEWGEKMADYAMSALENAQPVSLGTLQSKQVVVEAPVNHAFDHLYDQAAAINDYFKSTGDRATADKMCADAGISSVYHADTIVANRKRGQTMTMELNVYSIGDIGFIFAPVEMFDTNGMYIKENSPYAMTFICCYANYCQGYMPSKLAYEMIGYEVATTCWDEGTAEMVADQLLTMLEEVR